MRNQELIRESVSFEGVTPWKQELVPAYFAIKTNGKDFDWGVEFCWEFRIKPSSQSTGRGTLALQDGTSPLLTENTQTKCLQVFMPALASLKKRLRSTPCWSTLLQSSDKLSKGMGNFDHVTDLYSWTALQHKALVNQSGKYLEALKCREHEPGSCCVIFIHRSEHWIYTVQKAQQVKMQYSFLCKVLLMHGFPPATKHGELEPNARSKSLSRCDESCSVLIPFDQC